jgi:hypothetical protein
VTADIVFAEWNRRVQGFPISIGFPRIGKASPSMMRPAAHNHRLAEMRCGDFPGRR